MLKEVEFTAEELKVLKKERNQIFLFILILAIVTDALIILTSLKNFTSGTIISCAVLSSIVLSIAFLVFRFSNKDIKAGVKLIIHGTVSEKFASGGRATNYFMKINDVTVKLSKEQFQVINVAQKLEVHFTKVTKTAINIIHLGA